MQQIVRFQYAKELNNMDLPYVLLGFKLIVNVQDSNMNVHMWVITGKDFHKAGYNSNLKCHQKYGKYIPLQIV